MKRLLLIDNYDSFSYNIVDYIERITGKRPDVYRNDEISLQEVKKYSGIIISPGPGIPEEAGICLDVIRKYSPEKSILGVCLGHQAIGTAFGASLTNLDKVCHGLAKKVVVTQRDDILLKNIPHEFLAGRYHSWVVSRSGFPACLEITCVDENNLIMGIRHKEFNVHGIQFHPESVLTGHGMEILKNWIINCFKDIEA